MEQAILKFNTQFEFEPIIENKENFTPQNRFIVGGMGGSHLGADILKTVNPFLDMTVYRGYGLPPLPQKYFKDTLFIASSYSGNTEETIDFARTAYQNKHRLLCIAIGGKLLDFAKENGIPYIQMPDTGIQPRSALGFSALSIAKAMQDDLLFEGFKKLSKILSPADLKVQGENIAEELYGKVPVIYAPNQYETVAYNWKIKFNETAKIPAFYNVLPELNHNEMTGFDKTENTKNIMDKFHFIFIAGSDDHPQVLKRIEVTERLYEERGLPSTKIWLEGESRAERIFKNLLIADWTALTLSSKYDTESEQVPMVEEFKKLV